MASLESAARAWLTDSQRNTLLKNPCDLIKDQLNQVLVALAAISQTVLFLSNLQSGELLCIVIGVNVTDPFFEKISGPFHGTLAAYASQDPGCHRNVYVDLNPNHKTENPGFIKYGPIFLMLQVILLIGAGKIWMIFPRLSQNMERFTSLVETLMGSDPAIGEDSWEIFETLQESSLFYRLYVFRNIAEIILALFFGYYDWFVGVQTNDGVGMCEIPLGNNGLVKMQCRQKRFGFYMFMLNAFIVLLGVHALISITSLVWCIKRTRLRKISNIISCLKNSKHPGTERLLECEGEDYLFLFDLVAHTCGKSSILRVLTYTAPTFAELCQPVVQVSSNESKIHVQWDPSPLQDIPTQRFKTQKMIQKYVVTISPSSYTRPVTVKAAAPLEHDYHGLTGGTKEYTVTVSAFIGDSKMKGVSNSTFLLPSPPQHLKCVKTDANHEGAIIQIKWSRPKGEFDRYILKVAELKSGTSVSTQSSFSVGYSNSFQERFSVPTRIKRTRSQDEDILNKEEVMFDKTNLKPGSRYQVELRSMTGNNYTCLDEKVPKLLVLTKPLPPSKESFLVNAKKDLLFLSWEKPRGRGHSFLHSYKIILKKAGVLLLNKTVQQTSFTLEDNIISGTQYTVELATVCKDTTNNIDKAEDLETVSSPVTKTVVTPPLPPINLRLESVAETSIKVKWDPPTHIPVQGKLTYDINIIPESPEVRRVMADDRQKEVESNVYEFSNLPEIVGTGENYRVTVSSVFTPVTSGSSYMSDSVTEIFTTKPLPPEKLIVKDHNERIFSWFKSPSPGVYHYKLKIKRDHDKACDFIINDPDNRSLDKARQKQNMISFTLPMELENGIVYKVNIYSMVRDGQGRDGWIESKPLSSKIVKQQEAIKTDTDLETESDVFDAIADLPKITKMTVHRTTSKVVGDRPASDLRNSVDPVDKDDASGSDEDESKVTQLKVPKLD